MIDLIFTEDELPNYKVYEMAQRVVHDYMQKHNCKISVVAAKLETTAGTLYRQLNPKDTLMPMSVDRVIAITRLTQDYRILETIAKEFDLVIIPKVKEKAKEKDLSHLADIANIENDDVFKAVKIALEDGVISKEEKKLILKEINEAQKANARLKFLIENLKVEE